MKNRVLAAVILILPFGLFFYFWRHPAADEKPAVETAKSSPASTLAKELAAVPPQTTALIASNFAAPPQSVYYSKPSPPAVAPASTPAPLEFTNLAPEIVVENMRRAIHDYGSMFGGNPVGINSEITSQLSGDNPKHINFLKAEAGLRLNASGELIDPWGTPYFFHQLSGTDMEIHSAGPDRIMWTADDLVLSE
jgi:hypothetical protein